MFRKTNFTREISSVIELARKLRVIFNELVQLLELKLYDYIILDIINAINIGPELYRMHMY